MNILLKGDLIAMQLLTFRSCHSALALEGIQVRMCERCMAFLKESLSQSGTESKLVRVLSPRRHTI